MKDVDRDPRLHNCKDCKYDAESCFDEPCSDCFNCEYDDNKEDKFEPKEEKACKFCRFHDLEATDDPCRSCCGFSKFNPTKKENEEYACDECKYHETMFNEEPCHSCNDGSHFCRIEEENDNIPEPKPEPETVNHPSHYNREGAKECIEEMIDIYGPEATAYFCLLNAHKYRYRAADKNGEEDLRKSDWYYKKYCELVRESHITMTMRRKQS